MTVLLRSPLYGTAFSKQIHYSPVNIAAATHTLFLEPATCSTYTQGVQNEHLTMFLLSNRNVPTKKAQRQHRGLEVDERESRHKYEFVLRIDIPLSSA
jgi:hypothetical protein